MDKKLVSSSHQEDQPKAADGPRGVIGNKILIATLLVGTGVMGLVQKFSGSPDRPKNLKDAQVQLVEKLKGIFSSSPSEEELKEIFELELATRSPARRVDILLSELTFTLAEFITVYNDYEKAVKAGEPLEGKEQEVYNAVTRVINAIRNAANMPEDSRAPLALAGCKKAVMVLKTLDPKLPKRERGEMLEWGPNDEELGRLQAMVNRLLPPTEEGASAGLGIADPDRFYEAELIIGDFLEKNSDNEALSSADTSVVGGG